ncbi:MAG: AmmeMemoRadiSam system protein A [Candidatus Aminicenantes bacterium]|nr:AmmeMemoRadiSam system protein A [Candidatus Aminicenantes bacterium]
MPNKADKLTAEQGAYLLGLARQAIRHHLEDGSKPKIDTKDKILAEKRGAFVTLTLGHTLRGCIGYPLPVKPLAESVVDMAVAAATADPRFEPLGVEELDSIRVEVSVLGLPHKVRGPADVEVGKHGIIISKGFHKGLLLPQVPVEYHWDRDTFLSHGCLKAGMDEDEWKRGVTIEVFTAQIFHEERAEEKSE